VVEREAMGERREAKGEEGGEKCGRKNEHIESDAWLTGAPRRLFRSDPSVNPKHTLQ